MSPGQKERDRWYPGRLINTILDRWLKPTTEISRQSEKCEEVAAGHSSQAPKDDACPTCGNPRDAYTFMTAEQGLSDGVVERLFGLKELHRIGIINDAELEKRMTTVLQGEQEARRT